MKKIKVKTIPGYPPGSVVSMRDEAASVYLKNGQAEPVIEQSTASSGESMPRRKSRKKRSK